MRLFIALETSQEVKEHFLSIQKKINSNAKLNFVKNFHLTLKFLGEVNENNVDKIKEALEKIEFDSFEAKLDGIGCFPNEDYIRVVWVGIKPKDKIIELQQKIEQALIDLFQKDNKFHPHITLARVKFVNDKEAFKDQIGKIIIKPLSFKVDSFRLIKSTLTREGPVYEDLREIKAKGL